MSEIESQMGKDTMYEIGDKLRKLYPQFLERPYVTKHLTKVTAAGNEYTIVTRESALILREGLRGRNKKKALKRHWSTRRLATTHNHEFTDAASGFFRSCKSYYPTQNISLIEKLVPLFKSEREFQKVFKALKKHTEARVDYNYLKILHALYELYETTYYSGFKLPKWYTEKISDGFYKVMHQFVNISFSTDYLKTITGGRTLRYFLDTLDDKLNHKLEPCDTRMMVHVAYDANISPFFAALGGEKGFTSGKEIIHHFFPPSGGFVVIEAHQVADEEDFWLKVYTSESLYAPVRGLNITDCTVPCNYKQLRKLRQNIAVTKLEWEDKCEKGPEKIPK
ncbi:uncharacterized protein LOC113379203 [Ctenocephalides felis]|uniref:uncharacterized protein LOC113379203 n=1 Tax=Ctenocephalides felis TaxID=7515 RepID=UPI000E6E44D3|nr:uncharacterized protein LOC113379203 [Ctenocephalides felis]